MSLNRETLNLGNRRELFVDDFLVAKADGVRLQVCPPTRREVVWQADRAVESPTSGYHHLFKDGDRIRMYYRGRNFAKDPKDQSPEQITNYAESRDGIHFERPNLGLVEIDGSKDHNVLFVGKQAHNFFAFKDENPAAREDERYKAIGGGWQELFAYGSADGIHWHQLYPEKLDIEGTFDSLNVVFWDKCIGRYRMISRYFDGFTGGRNADGIEVSSRRNNQTCVSEDFRRWTPVTHHEYAPPLPEEEYYTNATTPCPGAGHILLAFPKRFRKDRGRMIPEMVHSSMGCSDTVLHTGRDGRPWHRFIEAWVRPGLDPRNWSHRTNMVAHGIIETAPDEWSMYIGGHYGWDSNHLQRLTLAPHRFASLHADADGGECLTHPLTFSGTELRLNFSTSVNGCVRIELQDAQGGALPGFAMEDMPALYGDALDQPVPWGANADLGALAGRPVRLRIRLQDADIYSLRFQ